MHLRIADGEDTCIDFGSCIMIQIAVPVGLDEFGTHLMDLVKSRDVRNCDLLGRDSDHVAIPLVQTMNILRSPATQNMTFQHQICEACVDRSWDIAQTWPESLP